MACLVVLISGIAAEIASVQEAGSAVATSQKDAAVGKVADGSYSPPKSSGATTPVDISICPTDDHGKTLSQRPGATNTLVPSGATSLAICRYEGMNPPPTGAQFQLLAAGKVTDPNAINQITTSINVLSADTGSSSCPAEDGSAVLAIFRYPSGSADPVRMDLGGCGGVTNGHVKRNWNMSLRQEILGLTSPVTTRVASLRGHVRGCGGIAPGTCHTITPTICQPTCHKATGVAAYNSQGEYVGGGTLRHGRFHFNVATAGHYTLKVMGSGQTLTTTTARARLGATTSVVFTVALK